ncbi:MAG: DUF4835 family protein [Paludibacter sp.]|nr:DUF4835 family protein [Paludibacter sp.]MDD4199214.1 DUF4835 family protein [Paludibacter sp.]MDD4428650.1 DUF4835 family protein [Paludibacter sp.]
MNRKYIRYSHLLFFLFLGTFIPAQELNCSLKINSDMVQGTNKSVFNTLEKSASDFLNNRRWTDLSYDQHEKIECNINIIVSKVEEELFTAEIQVQSRRPVFNSSYNTPLFNFRDNDFAFTYKEFEVLEFNENVITSNLTAVLTYYAYIIIGYDMDSYSRLGGTPYFQAAERIVNAAQSLDMPGWRAFESSRNRYALVNNITDEAFKKFRNYIYEYHRLGLDEMTINMVNARAHVSAGLSVLRETNRSRPSAIAVTSFLDAKTDELINIYKRATDQEKKNVIEILSDINPTQSERYESIMK